MTLISRPSPDQSGFTLVELLVVLTIMGLLAVLAVPRIGQRPMAIVRAEAATKVESALLEAKRAARASGVAQPVDPASIVSGSSWIPDEDDTPANALVFYPDGSSSGGAIMLDGRPLLTINWLTGVVNGHR